MSRHFRNTKQKHSCQLIHRVGISLKRSSLDIIKIRSNSKKNIVCYIFWDINWCSLEPNKPSKHLSTNTMARNNLGIHQHSNLINHLRFVFHYNQVSFDEFFCFTDWRCINVELRKIVFTVLVFPIFKTCRSLSKPNHIQW